MEYERMSFMLDKARGIAGGTAEVPKTEEGWWVVAQRSNVYQSWERPFGVNLAANVNPTWDGPSLFCDTGEAFCHFEQAPHQFPGFAGLTGGLPPLKAPLPHTGRPDRAWPGAEAYLNKEARSLVGPTTPLRCVWSGVAGETKAEAEAREVAKAAQLRNEFADYRNNLFTYVVNRALDRTVVRVYEYQKEGEPVWLLFLGATFSGYDLLYYPARLNITAPPAGAAFGQAPLDKAEIYQTMWMITRRFGGSCPKNYQPRDTYLAWVIRFGLSAAFDEAILAEMRERTKSATERDTEQLRRDNEGMHRLNLQMEQDLRVRQQRIEEGRARSWERKLELDRRTRDQWSEANRGVDRFRGPHGELVEFRQGCPHARAYYDRLSDTIIYTDRIEPNLEELPRWDGHFGH